MARSKTTKRKVADNSDDDGKLGKGKKRRVVAAGGKGDILVDTSVFGELVTGAGVVLKAGNKPNELTQDQAVFQKKLAQSLKRNSSYPEVVDEFVEGLVNHIEDIVRFRWSLMPSIVPLDSDACSRGGTLDSMMRLLLGVDIIQPKLMEKLLEKLAELSGDEEAIFDDVEKVNLPRLILSQFRWLDRIVNSKDLVEKMFEILTVTSAGVQREIISCMPEIIEDSQHSLVAKQLRDLLMESNELTVPVLDALSNMSLKPELLSEVRESVMQTLQSVSLQDMPVIIKFLLQTVTPADALEVVKELRAQVDFNSCVSTKSKTKSHSKGFAKGKAVQVDRSVEALTFDAIRSAVRFQRFVAEAWLKAIDGVKSGSEHKPLDLVVLLILHSNNYKKPIESLFRNKIRAGRFTHALLQTTFSNHSEVLRDYFPSILSLAEVLLRSVEPNITHFACSIYKHGFRVFDTYCQQEIVGNLVTHIGSGFESEVDASLDILLDLGNKCIDKMAPFIIFIKGVLDYMDNLSVGQIRKLYSLLSTLAFQNTREEGMIQDELHILIRKQLAHTSPKYQRMGVIGAIMVTQSMANITREDSSTSDGGEISEESCKQVISLLQLVKTSCKRSSEAGALFMDELATVISKGSVDRKVEAWIAENVTADFQDDFVVDIEPDTKLPETCTYKMCFGLDDESEGSIVINLMPLLMKSYQSRAQVLHAKAVSRKCAPLCLSPNFRLLQICEHRQNSGDLEGIDALLGCPLYVADLDALDKVDSLSVRERELVAESIFLTINWFIELLNAFGCQEDAEMKGKVITRLQNITELQKALTTTLAATPDYIPPPANFDLDNVKPPTAPKPAAAAKKGRKPGKGKKTDDKENTKDDSDESRDSTMLEKESQVADKDTTTTQITAGDVTKSTVDITAYKPFFRELDLSVFDMLRVGLISRAALDTDMNIKDTTVLQIQPPQLEFLLNDLVRKTDHALMASKRRTFLKTKVDKNVGFGHLDQLSPVQVCTRMVQLLPALCDQLESTSAFFQTLQAAQDGVLDGLGYNTDEAQLMASCFHLLIQILLNIFSWNGFQVVEHRTLQKEALGVLSSRLDTTVSSQMSVQELLKHGFQYLEHFSASLPNLSAAVSLCKLLVALSDMADSTEVEGKIGVLSKGLLKREWFGSDGERAKGAKHNEQINTLLKIYLEHSSDVLGCLEDIAAVGVPELIEADREGYSTTYPTLTRSSYLVFYRVMLSELASMAKTILPSKPTEHDDTKMDKLYQWNIAVRIFHILVNLIKTFEGRSNLNALLKYGRQFVEIFLRQGMPMLDHMFRRHKDDVQSLLKNLQLSTRALQHLCGHSKILRDISLTNQVPLMKKALEGFVYRVKAMLTVNKCMEAFWLGNLKNRDIRGEEILSQSTTLGDTTQDSDNEELPEDDDDSEVEIEKESVGSKAGGEPQSESDDESYSETF